MPERTTAQKYQCGGICTGVSAGVLILIAAFIPSIFEGIIEGAAKSGAALTQENETNWKGIPGAYDIELNWVHYLYQVTNHDDVIYSGASPEYKEFGPYTYREYDEFTELDYSQKLEDNDSGKQRDAVLAKFKQYTEHVEKDTDDQDIDTPLKFVNQAAMGVWWGQNNAPKWRVYVTLLWSVIVDGLGTQVADQAIFEQIQTRFKSEADINKHFVVVNKIEDPAIVTALYTDANYGLNNADNYYNWNKFVIPAGSETDESVLNARLAWKLELRTYFHLTHDQVNEMEQQWNHLYTSKSDFFYQTTTVSETYRDARGIAYWQWAASRTTELDFPTQQSVVYSTDTVTGYPEISFWKSDYFMKTASQANQAAFEDVILYIEDTLPVVGPNDSYIHLFNILDENLTPGSNPASTSLFHIDNLKQLIALGEAAPNILKDTGKTYGVDFDLSTDSDWVALAQALSINTDEVKAVLDVKQIYFIWLWMETAWDLTFARTQDGGNLQIGVIGTLGATALSEVMDVMSLELGAMTYATALELNVVEAGTSCHDFYTNDCGWTNEAAVTGLCKSPTYNWSDPFLTSYALVNLFLYRDTFNKHFYTEFFVASGISQEDADTYIYSETSVFATMLDTQAVQPVYNHYKDTICNQQIVSRCSFSALSYNQWLSGAVLKNPLPGQKVTDNSYQRNYQKYSILSQTPELSYFAEKSGQKMPNASIDDVYAAFEFEGLYNGKIFQDIFLSVDYPASGNVWTSAAFKKYLQFVAIQFGLNGLFIELTPRQMIEGYNDPLIETLRGMPVYQGGDQTVSSFLSLDKPPTHPDDNTVAFYTGEDNYELTRTYAQWLGQDQIMIKAQDYKSLTEVEDILYAPWPGDDNYFDGTDGMQFHPLLSEKDTIGAFVNDLSRTCYFDYSKDDDRYEGITTMIFVIQEAMMTNSTANPDNIKYSINVSGTTNMTSTVKAAAFASKGHFYQISDEAKAKGSVPKIVDANGTVMEGNFDRDDTYLGMEKFTGVNTIAMERIQLNFAVYNDELFELQDNNEYGKFVPLLFVSRESTMTSAQITAIFGDLISGIKGKWLVFGILFGIGFLLLAITAALLCKAYNEKKTEKENEDLGLISSRASNMEYDGKLNYTTSDRDTTLSGIRQSDV